MNKAAIKNFAVEARKKLLASVKDRAGLIGITKEKIAEPINKGEGYAIFPTYIGTEVTLTEKERQQRDNLVTRIKEKGYDPVMEEVAYTWFNRIIAIRFMEVNDYLPSRIRVLSSETKGKIEPDIVTRAPDIDLNLTEQEIEEIISLKEKNELDKLFQMLFIKQCNELGKVLPELFENTSNKGYTEILLDISYTNEDGVIRELLKIDEADFWEAVEIMGWMYQYYNTEPKDETFALLRKNIKITKERIPAATQLFTPHWIVRYMVENSLGRLWLEGHPDEELKKSWKYYLDEAEQEPEVQKQLEKIKAEYKNIKPEDIKVIDPCMGSGHILVYAFEVLMQIYTSCGYTRIDAARLIVEKNLYGLDIDDRAYQLAYFAVMMKGREYDRRFLTKGISPNLYPIQESNNLISFEQGAGQLKLDDLHKETANYLVDVFRDAKEYGAILNVEQRDYDGLLNYIGNLQQSGAEDLFMLNWLNNISAVMPGLIKQAKILAQKFDVVVTNPPYMGSRGMGPRLSDFVGEHYPDSKSDLFAVFIEKCGKMTKKNGYQGMITQHAWMFLSSFEKLREKLMQKDIINMAHLGAKAFEEIGGEVVQTTSWITRKSNIQTYNATYVRLVDYNSQHEKENAFLAKQNLHIAQKENITKIPGIPIAYWVSAKWIILFEKDSPIERYTSLKKGMSTGDNERFIRCWYEPNTHKIGIAYTAQQAKSSKRKWFPINSGGAYRKWYGNNYYVVNWENDGQKMKDNAVKLNNGGHWSRYIVNTDKFFYPGITWSAITSGKIGVRSYDNGFLFSSASMCGFGLKSEYVLALLNSNVAMQILSVLAPTINYGPKQVKKIPCIVKYESKIVELAKQNIALSKTDWDSFEISWDFMRHPLLIYSTNCKRISDAYNGWQQITDSQFAQLKANEEELNRIFIDIYGLQDELTPEVDDKDVTIRKADLERDMRSFISYAVGCMFGRYSLDVDGLAYAGGEWDDSKYKTFIPDKDNVIPITDEEYFDDDIVARFIDFVKAAFGEDTLEENLDFIAKALGNPGSTSREIIRNYFLRDFYIDHVRIYKKRPIYWLFDSGRGNGFKALIYMHRYNEDTVGRVRTDYLHKTQAAIENAIAHCDIVLESSAAASEKAKAVKQKEKLTKQLAEVRFYDQAIAHIAYQRIPLDLDDGVKVNYTKFQGVEVSREGKKTVKVNLLGKI